MNINKVIIGGNLTRDPELRHTPKGFAVCDLTIANNETWYNDDKEKQTRTHFVECVAWGNVAENIAKFFSKGNTICIEGSIQQDTWEDKTSGQKRSKLKIKVDSFHFCGGKRDETRWSEKTSNLPKDREAMPPELTPEAKGDCPF